MKPTQIYALQQQAKQLRELERHTAEQSGQPLRKPSLIERLILGVKRR